MSSIKGVSYDPYQYQLDQLKNRADQVKETKPKEGQEAKLYEACRDFEAIFFQLMFKEMRKTVEKSELTDAGFGEEVFQGMLDEEVAKSAANRGGSIADVLYKQLRLQLNLKTSTDQS